MDTQPSERICPFHHTPYVWGTHDNQIFMQCEVDKLKITVRIPIRTSSYEYVKDSDHPFGGFIAVPQEASMAAILERLADFLDDAFVHHLDSGTHIIEFPLPN